jgi:hypothetical protein
MLKRWRRERLSSSIRLACRVNEHGDHHDLEFNHLLDGKISFWVPLEKTFG